MRRVFAFITTVIMLFFSIPIYASATSNSERELAIARACELFPEHSTVIRNEGVGKFNAPRSKSDKIKVFEETRAYSDNLDITYTEYSDGTAFVAVKDYTKEIVPVDSEIIGTYLVRHTLDITVYSNYNSSKKVEVNDIVWVVDQLWYDNIEDRGSISSDSVSSANFSSFKEWEDSEGDAYSSYTGDLPDHTGLVLDCTITFYAGGGSCYISISQGVS